MSRQSRCAWVVGGALMCWSGTAFGADLLCVQQAMAWNAAPPISEKPRAVFFTAVALHPNGKAGYVTGVLVNSICTRAPWAAGTVGCLKTFGRSTIAAVSEPLQWPAFSPLEGWEVDVIPADNLAQVHISRPGATYDFDPRCLGADMLIGEDQWGNHWMISLMKTVQNPPR